MGPSNNLGIDLGTSGGQWLFRQGELLLGPVLAAEIVEKLYRGEIDGSTEVQRLGTAKFERISTIEFFKLHVAKSEAKLRVDAAAREVATKTRRRHNFRITAVAIVAIAFATGAAFTARYLAVNKPWKRLTRFAETDIQVEPPTITRAKARDAEDLVEYPGRGTGARKPVEKSKTLASRSDRSSAKPAKLSSASAEPDGLQVATFDQEAINSVVAARQKTLFPCLVAAAQRNPRLTAKIPIEFVVGNDGRVTKVWVDYPELKDGEFPECLLRELQKWPFKPYEGERATVGLSFKIGRKG